MGVEKEAPDAREAGMGSDGTNKIGALHDRFTGAVRELLSLTTIDISRHESTEKNQGMIKRLVKLEKLYGPGGSKENQKDYERCLDIRFLKDYIFIGGRKVDYENVKIPTSFEDGIYPAKGEQVLFMAKTARSLKIEGKRTPNEQDMDYIIEAIPGGSDGSRQENMSKLLNMPYVGYCDRDNKGYQAGVLASVWYFPSDSDEIATTNLYKGENDIIRTRHSGEPMAHSLRLIQD